MAQLLEVVSKWPSPVIYGLQVTSPDSPALFLPARLFWSPGFSVTKIGLTETRLGIIPGAGGTQRLTRLIGVSRTKDLVFTARALTAHQALDYGTQSQDPFTLADIHPTGVVDYVSEDGKTGFDRALRLAGEISANGPLAVRAAKQAISQAVEFPLEAGLDFERASYEPLLHSKDRLEALEAFKAKRLPQFKGE